MMCNKGCSLLATTTLSAARRKKNKDKGEGAGNQEGALGKGGM